MNISAVNNISFAGRNPEKDALKAEKAALKAEKKAIKQAQKDAHSVYISQMQANDALKMSVGRELEDGKYKKAQFLVGGLGGLGLAISSMAKFNADLLRTAAEFAGDEYKNLATKYTKNSKIAGVAMAVSAGALIVSSVIKNINEAKANKTANERGFLNEGDYGKFKSKEEAYVVTNEIYNMHVNA